MKVAVYTCAKNEEENVPYWLGCSEDADYRVVVDTGSTDRTGELLAVAGPSVRCMPASVKPWRFDVGRNLALCFIPDDADVCIKLDFDERLQPGWRKELERVWTPKTTRVWYNYIWDWKVEDSVPNTSFRNNLIHSRNGYFWRHPTHEALYPMGIVEEFTESDIQINQYPSLTSHPHLSKDLELLEYAVEENRCPRTLFYLGREYFFKVSTPGFDRLVMMERCIKTLGEYLTTSTFKSERAEAKRMISLLMRWEGKITDAVEFGISATIDDPLQRECWVDLAWAYKAAGDKLGVIYAIGRARSITDPRYIKKAYAWDDTALEELLSWALS
jgi:glycosyltransferase involved in cell wall biosynthesis